METSSDHTSQNAYNLNPQAEGSQETKFKINAGIIVWKHFIK